MFSVVIPFFFLSGTQIEFQWVLPVCGCCAFPAGSCALAGDWIVKALQQDDCPVETMRNQFEKSQSLEMMSERHSRFLGRFGMENLTSPGIGQAW